MKSLVYTAIYCFIWYIVLIVAGGTLAGGALEAISIDPIDLIFGLVGSVLVAFLTRGYFVRNENYRMLSPARWGAFIVYIGVLLVEMAKANIDVAIRVITNNINPGIVRITPDLKQDLSVALLANSITLTPGTLTVDVDPETNDLFIHCINVSEEMTDGGDPTEAIAGKFLGMYQEDNRMTLTCLGSEALFFVAGAFMLFAVLAALRLLIGPTAPDRAVALDTINTLVVLGMIVLGAAMEEVLFIDVAIVYALLSFITTLYIARYLESKGGANL